MSNNFMKSRKPSKSPKAAVRLLIEQLVEQGGAIVTSQECSIIEIADAQATGRWAVDDEGIGYVRRYREWLDRHKTCESKVRRQLETWKRTIRNRNGITWNEMDAGDTLRLRKSIVEIEAALKLDATERDLVATIERENMKRNLSEAVNLSCSCGGNPAGTEACPACMVWHRMSPND